MLQVDKRAQKKHQGQEKSWAEGWAGHSRAISVNKAAQNGLGVLTTRWQFINPGKNLSKATDAWIPFSNFSLVPLYGLNADVHE